jgi:hypothetical protein
MSQKLTELGTVSMSFSDKISSKKSAECAEPHVPNEKTIEAMKEARCGKLPHFDSVQALMADLNEND